MPADRTAVNTNDLGELIWWSAHFGTGPEKLLSVINKVGNSAQKIRISIYESNKNAGSSAAPS